MTQTFEEFFQAGTEKTAFPFQRRLAQEPEWPMLLQAPTGSGKTRAVLIAWLWRRRGHPNAAIRAATPRRLAYCLPMRTLVEQTQREAERILRRLQLTDIAVHVLMGGEDETDWEIYAEREEILIGTQDMLLSRALNRGYAQSRFAWPIAFGLLNSDTLWVLDEVQLMANGLATSVQLDGLRAALGTYGSTRSLWMSATIDPRWLQTPDSRIDDDSRILQIEAEDRADPTLRKFLTAPKTLHRLPIARDVHGPARDRRLADAIAKIHIPGSVTLVVVNTVARAQGVYENLADSGTARALVHSRFRPIDRREQIDRLLNPGSSGLIACATQVVEAGIDTSSRTLVTELAPWSSLVQRFGRCNRWAEQDRAEAYWVDLDEKRDAAPYSAEQLDKAREQVERLDGRSISPDSLPGPEDGPEHDYIIRRRDLIDLFDTTPDLMGADIDVSRFVRGTDETDVRLFWRDWGTGEPPKTEPAPRRDELCPVPLDQARAFLKTSSRPRGGYRWDHLAKAWERVAPADLRPGEVLLLPASAGGYDPTLGWCPGFTGRVEPVKPPLSPPSHGTAVALESSVGRRGDSEARRAEPPESTDDDPMSQIGVTLTIDQHTADVVAELDQILNQLDGVGIESREQRASRRAARFHDWGKGHPVFQTTLRGREPTPGELLLAKAHRNGQRHTRKYFRHELGSALAYLQQSASEPESLDPNLVAYLIAAHHGKVRLAIRTAPGEDPVVDKDRRCALGIHDGDELPVVDLGGGVTTLRVTLSLAPALLGRADDDTSSWIERATALRDALGPFRLAYLEALIRCADVRASKKEASDPDSVASTPTPGEVPEC